MEKVFDEEIKNIIKSYVDCNQLWEKEDREVLDKVINDFAIKVFNALTNPSNAEFLNLFISLPFDEQERKALGNALLIVLDGLVIDKCMKNVCKFFDEVISNEKGKETEISRDLLEDMRVFYYSMGFLLGFLIPVVQGDDFKNYAERLLNRLNAYVLQGIHQSSLVVLFLFAKLFANKINLNIQ